MKLISEVLQEKGLKQNELPEQIKHEIEELRVMIVKYNEACDEYDEEDENISLETVSFEISLQDLYNKVKFPHIKSAVENSTS